AERSVRLNGEVLIDPDRAGVDPRRHSERPLTIRRPNRTAQAKLRVVDTRNHLVDVGIPQYRQNRAELLLTNEPGTVGDVTHDGRLNEVALPFQGAASGDDRPVPPSILKEPLHPLELRRVLDRPHLRARLHPVTDDCFPRESAEFVAD